MELEMILATVQTLERAMLRFEAEQKRLRSENEALKREVAHIREELEQSRALASAYYDE